jgi:hypothetical protein
MTYFKHFIVLLPLMGLLSIGETFAHRESLARRQQADLNAQRRTPARQPIIPQRSVTRATPVMRVSPTRMNRHEVNTSVSKRPIPIHRPSELRTTQLRTPPTRPVMQINRLCARPAPAKSPVTGTPPQRPLRTLNIPPVTTVRRMPPVYTAQTRHLVRTPPHLSARRGLQVAPVPLPTPQEPPKAPPKQYTVTFQEMPPEYQAFVQEKCAQKGGRPPAPNHPVIIPHNSVKDVIHRCLKDLETKPHLRERVPHIKQRFISTLESKGYRGTI